MAGGIAILLLIIIVIVAVVIGFGVSTTGGILWWRKTDPRADRVEGTSEDDGETRPRHTRPTTPAQESTHFVGED